MKRKIALLLAVVMILSLVPMMSFATSSNTVSRVLIVNDDDNFSDASFTVIPQLVLEPKDNTWGASESFYLELPEGVEWNLSTVGPTAIGATENKNTVSYAVYSGALPSSSYELEKVTKRRLNVKLTNVPQGTKVQIPLNVELDKPEGDVTVSVVADGSAVSPGKYTFATVSKGDTKITIDTVNRIVEDGTINTIFIEETVRGSFVSSSSPTRNLRFLLPNHFEFKNTNVTYEVGGGFAPIGATTVTGTLSNGDRQISFDVPVASAGGGNQQRGWIKITGLSVKASADAPEGDVILRARGDLTSEDVKALTKVGYGMEVKIKDDKDPKEIFAGRLENVSATPTTAAGDEIHQLARLRIREDFAGAWLNGRRTTIEFPSWVKIMDIDVKTADYITHVNGNAVSTTGQVANALLPSDRGDNKLEFSVATSSTQRALLEIDFYVSVAADEAGDIVASVGGSGFAGEWHEVVLGKAIAPVTLEAEIEDVRIGLKNQPIGTITITENKEGAIQSSTSKNLVQLELDPWMEWSKKPTVTVDGELTIDKDSIKIQSNGRVLQFKVTGSSVDEPAVITVEGGAVDVSRAVPEGKFAVSIGGDALVNNTTEILGVNLDTAGFAAEFVAEADVVNVITPAPGEVIGESVTLTIGVVPEGGDVAPYIKNARTFAPVSSVAQALGVAKSNIIWNEEARTVTILGSKTVQMTIGETTLLVNGTPVVMDVAPEITSSRTFLPIAWLAKALDVEYSWDAATQSVTFY